jgi:hypothetical protein
MKLQEKLERLRAEHAQALAGLYQVEGAMRMIQMLMAEEAAHESENLEKQVQESLNESAGNTGDA